MTVNSIAELIQYAKTYLGKLSYFTPGVGMPQHLATELFKSMTTSDIVLIVYTGVIRLLPGQSNKPAAQ